VLACADSFRHASDVDKPVALIGDFDRLVIAGVVDVVRLDTTAQARNGRYGHIDGWLDGTVECA